MSATESLPALEAMREAADTAMNDEIIEVAIFLHDLMVDRCENAVEMAIAADDRDAMNEAFVLVRQVKNLLPSWLRTKNGRAESTYWRHLAVEERINEAISDSREGSRGPAPSRGRTRAVTTKPKEVTLEPFTDDELVEAHA